VICERICSLPRQLSSERFVVVLVLAWAAQPFTAAITESPEFRL
jgi:hypothetical protein